MINNYINNSPPELKIPIILGGAYCSTMGSTIVYGCTRAGFSILSYPHELGHILAHKLFYKNANYYINGTPLRVAKKYFDDIPRTNKIRHFAKFFFWSDIVQPYASFGAGTPNRIGKFFPLAAQKFIVSLGGPFVDIVMGSYLMALGLKGAKEALINEKKEGVDCINLYKSCALFGIGMTPVIISNTIAIQSVVSPSKRISISNNEKIKTDYASMASIVNRALRLPYRLCAGSISGFSISSSIYLIYFHLKRFEEKKPISSL